MKKVSIEKNKAIPQNLISAIKQKAQENNTENHIPFNMEHPEFHDMPLDLEVQPPTQRRMRPNMMPGMPPPPNFGRNMGNPGNERNIREDSPFNQNPHNNVDRENFVQYDNTRQNLRTYTIRPTSRVYPIQSFPNHMENVRVFMDNARQMREMERGKEQQLVDLAKATIDYFYGDILGNAKLIIKMNGTISDVQKSSQVQFTSDEVDDFVDRQKSKDDFSEKSSVENNTQNNDENVKEEEDLSLLDRLKSYFQKDKKQDANSVNTNTEKKDKNIFEYENLSDELKLKIHRRKFMNNIIQGEAKNTKTIFHTDFVRSGLRRIFGDRFESILSHYNWISNIADCKDWELTEQSQMNMWKHMPNGFAGRVKVSWEDEEEDDDIDTNCDACEDDSDGEEFENKKRKVPVIEVEATDFTMCLHESVKGIYELISAKSISEDKLEAKIVKHNTDHYLNEIEDIKFGPHIAAKIRDIINSNPNAENVKNMRERVYGALCDIKDDNEFLVLINGILSNDSDSLNTFNELINQVYMDYETYMAEMEEYQQQMEDYQRQLEEYNRHINRDSIQSDLIKEEKDYSYLEKMTQDELADLLLDTNDDDIRSEILKILNK